MEAFKNFIQNGTKCKICNRSPEQANHCKYCAYIMCGECICKIVKEQKSLKIKCPQCKEILNCTIPKNQTEKYYP